MRVQDKVIVVTGAAQGIGEAYARALAGEGAKVVVADINEESGQQVVKHIQTDGGAAMFVPCDVSSAESATALVAAVEEAVTVGDIVRLMTLREGGSNLIALTLPDDSALVGATVADLRLPGDAALLTILRNGTVVTPNPRTPLLAGDELVLAVGENSEAQVRQALTGQSA